MSARLRCTRRRLRRLAALLAVTAATALVFRRRVEPWLLRSGATDAERTVPLPVDDVVQPGATSGTRAITIAAPIAEVWPWLVQIGQDRAGFYSYTMLENLVGANMRNASHVEPQWQERLVGDSVWLADRERWGDRGRQIVAVADPPRALVLVSPGDWTRLQDGGRAKAAWGFFLRPVGERETRFLVRSSGPPVGSPLFDVLHFVMEHRMMRGLRDRAEAVA